MKIFVNSFIFFILISCSSSSDDTQESLDDFTYRSEIKTLEITNLNPYSFTSSVIAPTPYQFSTKGICYSEHPNPNINDGFIDYEDAGESHQGYADLRVTGLKPNTKYYVRGYIKNYKNVAENSQVYNIAYGNTIELTTLDIDNLSIGGDYAGGKIAYILKPDDFGYDPEKPHGLITIGGNPSASVFEYGCIGRLINANSDNFLGAGSQNTNASIIRCSARGYASGRCYTIEFNEYTDFYLPSLYELLMIRSNLRSIYPPGIYWSSTEISGSSASAVNFSMTNGSLNSDKNNSYKVIPVRRF